MFNVPIVDVKPVTHSEVSASVALIILAWHLPADQPRSAPISPAVACRISDGVGRFKWYVYAELLLACPAVNHADSHKDQKTAQEAFLAKGLTILGWPALISLDDLQHALPNEGALSAWLWGPAGRRGVPERLKALGYIPFPNPNEKKGRWLVNGRQLKRYRKDPTVWRP